MIDDPEARARVGHVLSDKWTLEALLGIGGMGAVYSARHRNGARAAVKLLHAELARHPEVRERFLREGKAANQVEHPGVVKVIDDDVVKEGPEEGSAYLVMELLSGISLEERIERGPKMTEQELLGVLDAVLDVLVAAHARGVVHRDLKPENLFLARDESGATRIKVLDFGLARLRDANTNTRYGVALGTPSYMSPEQASGRHDEVDGRSDLFSLAAGAFRIVCGRKVHEGEGPVDQVLKMSSLPAPRVHDVAPGVSQPVARVLDRALQFRREDRYPDAATMQAEVRRSLAELGAPIVPAALAPTMVALPPISTRGAEPTLEVSARDLVPGGPEAPTKRVTVPDVAPPPMAPPPPRAPQPSRAAEAPAPSKRAPEAPAPSKRAPETPPSTKRAPAPEPPPPPSRVAPSPDASIDERLSRLPMRRMSTVPIVTVLVLGGIALKVAIDAREPAAPSGVDAGASLAEAAASVAKPAPVPAPVTVDAAAEPPEASAADAGEADSAATSDAALDSGDEDAEAEEEEEETADAAPTLAAPHTTPSAPRPRPKTHAPKPRVRRHHGKR